MIFLSDRYTEGIGELRKTLDCLGTGMKIVVCEDEAFLPSGISSPYEYYIAKQNRGDHSENTLFYDSLPVPEYWDVYDNGKDVKIYYMGCERATIYFREQRAVELKGNSEGVLECNNSAMENGSLDAAKVMKKGVVERVEWHLESGWIYRVDFYNKYALKYTSEFRDTNGFVESKVFYSDRNQEIIVEYPGNNVVTLLENGVVKAFFNSRKEFLEYYVEEVSRNEKRAIFVQDEKMLEALDIKSDSEQAWNYALFSNGDLLNKYISLGGKNGIRFYAIPENYPENKARSEALILTMSDQIERIEDLTQELPEMTFHIAANTLVSDKLNRLGEKENVNIYPCVSQEKLKELWDKCDFYLDINHWREIYDAVNVAHQNNLLIMGFENTLHHGELLVKGCKFSRQDYKKMVLVIKYVMKSPELMQKLLLVQQRKKKAIWKELLKSKEDEKQ